MVHIGFNASNITLVIVVLSIVSLLLNFPSGFLADRWSRKGILVIACVSMALASLLLGLSTDVFEYPSAVVLYGVYAALYSGVNDAIIYDTLLEENGTRKGFEKYLGYSQLSRSLGLVIGSLTGGVIAEAYSLSAPYFYTIPSCIIAILFLLLFQEPVLHKNHPALPAREHIAAILFAMFRKSYVAWIIIALISTSALYEFLLEVYQLWPLALKMGVLWYGPLNALLVLGYGLGSPLAAVLLKKRGLIIGSCVLGALFAVMLTIKNMPIVTIAQLGAVVMFVALNTIALGRLHDTLPVHLRSSSSSTVGTLGAIVFIPSLLLFGHITQYHSVFVAAQILVVFAFLGVIGMVFVTSRTTTQPGDYDRPRPPILQV